VVADAVCSARTLWYATRPTAQALANFLPRLAVFAQATFLSLKRGAALPAVAASTTHALHFLPLLKIPRAILGGLLPLRAFRLVLRRRPFCTKNAAAKTLCL